MRGERIGPGGLAGLQNRDGDAFGDSGGFDSHTLPPPGPAAPPGGKTERRTTPPPAQPGGKLRSGTFFFSALSALSVLSAVGVRPGWAQDTLPAPPRPAQDTAVFPRPPVTPLGGFFRSLLVPGWSQALLGRRLTGGLFMAWEGVTLGMTLKASRELRHLRAEGDSTAIDKKKQEREDWLALLLFNHLFAGLEAFVAAHLWDFPEDVRVRAVPSGVDLRVSLPIRLR